MPNLKNAVIICVFLFLSSCNNNEFIIHGKTMGTTYTIKSDTFIDKKIIDKKLKEINAIFSNWEITSEVNKINNLVINKPITISNQLKQLILLSKKVNLETNGYFDIGIGRLIDIWGFGIKKINNKPTNLLIKKALEKSGIKYIKIDKNILYKYKDINLNLSAIAKGYGIDEIIKILVKYQVKSGLVEIGGEVRVLGTKRIAIERINKKPIEVVLINQAIATSGDYRNYQIFNNTKFIHIINPMTGFPSKSDLVSVSVIGDNTALVDSYASAILAMGKKQAIKFIQKYKLKSVLIDKNNIVYKFNL